MNNILKLLGNYLAITWQLLGIFSYFFSVSLNTTLILGLFFDNSSSHLQRWQPTNTKPRKKRPGPTRPGPTRPGPTRPGPTRPRPRPRGKQFKPTFKIIDLV